MVAKEESTAQKLGSHFVLTGQCMLISSNRQTHIKYLTAVGGEPQTDRRI
jgi:hypothetical protein